MIKYAIQCEVGHAFEGWFRNSDDFDNQIAAGHLQCPVCGSGNVAKSLMAPSVSGTRSQDQISKEPNSASLPAASLTEEQQGQMQDMLRALRKSVVESSDYVGDKFAEEARKIHFKETEKRGIYGEATVDEVKSLAEDGIDCLPLPVLPEDQN